MSKGSRYWANSYVVLKNGQKLYVDNYIYDIEEKIRSKKKIIELNLFGIYGKTISVPKTNIYYYGSI